jgi:hypothetical protein
LNPIFLYNVRSIRVWSLKTYEILEILRGHEDEIEVNLIFEIKIRIIENVQYIS